MLWSSAEFGFCELADAWSSGSSIMPQKKNPDAAELLRGKAPRVVGHLAAFHGVIHALPLTYNKDLQEDKEHLFDTVDTIELTLAAAAGMLDGAVFDRERMQQAAGDEMIAATDVADLLVKLGIPFREAHGIVAGLVRTAVDGGRPLSGLSRRSCAPSARCSPTMRPSCTKCSHRAPGWSRRSPRAAPRSAGCASSSLSRGPSSTPRRDERAAGGLL